MKKKIFDVYSYQFNPLTNVSLDVDYTSENAMKEKNSIFQGIFEDELRFNYRNLDLNYNLPFFDDNYIILKIANKKYITREKDFKEEKILTEPSSTIIIDNHSDIQRMFIESDRDSFRKSNVLKEIIEKTFSNKLKNFGLGLTINSEYDVKEFWKLIEGKKDEIEAIKFLFSYYNLPRAHKSLEKELKEFGNDLNAAHNNYEFKADKGSTLTKLNKENKTLNDFVKASAEGAGPIKIKQKNVLRWKSTEHKNKSREIEVEIPLEIDKEQLQIILNALNKAE